MISSRSQPLYPRQKNLRYPSDRKLGEPHSRYGRYGHYRAEENPSPLPGIKPRFLGCPSRNLVVIMTELFGLPKLCSFALGCLTTDVKWSLVSTTWSVFWLQMVETAYRYSVWKTVDNTLNKQSPAAEKWWSILFWSLVAAKIQLCYKML
jgi:hypothetical protein